MTFDIPTDFLLPACIITSQGSKGAEFYAVELCLLRYGKGKVAPVLN